MSSYSHRCDATVAQHLRNPDLQREQCRLRDFRVFVTAFAVLAGQFVFQREIGVALEECIDLAD